jgi:hypothetical protein
MVKKPTPRELRRKRAFDAAKSAKEAQPNISASIPEPIDHRAKVAIAPSFPEQEVGRDA